MHGSSVVDRATFTVGRQQYAIEVFAFDKTLAASVNKAHEMKFKFGLRDSHRLCERSDLVVARPHIAGSAATAAFSALSTSKS